LTERATLAACWLAVLITAGPAARAEDTHPKLVVFSDGTQVAVRRYELRDNVVVFETTDGKLRSASRDYIDLVAMDRVNGAVQQNTSPVELAAMDSSSASSALTLPAGGPIIIDGPPPPVPPDMVSRDAMGRVTLRAVRLVEPIVVDGRLDDAAYDRVPAVASFVQQEPEEGKPATEPTEVWIFFDDATLYVTARCWDSHPERIVTNELRRGNVGISRGDNLTVVLDTFYDRRNGFFFQTNPLGGVYDSLVTDERNENIDWDTVWDTHSAFFENGWSVEIAIPFESLRYHAGSDQVWGINIRRIVQWKNEMSFLNPVPASYGRSAIMKTSSSAALVGLELPAKSVNLEVRRAPVRGRFPIPQPRMLPGPPETRRPPARWADPADLRPANRSRNQAVPVVRALQSPKTGRTRRTAGGSGSPNSPDRQPRPRPRAYLRGASPDAAKTPGHRPSPS